MLTIKVYIDTGVVYEYEVGTHEAAREHADAIVKTGYRSCNGTEITVWPPHRVSKVKVIGDVSSNYMDKVSGT